MVPSCKTTSSPRTRFLVMPYLKTRSPPAFVEIIPPICADPLAPKFNGKSMFFSSAAIWTFSKMAPDWTVIVLLPISISSMEFIFSNEITMSLVLVLVLPTKLVNPPCTTMFCLCSEHIFMILATSSVVWGKITASAWSG